MAFPDVPSFALGRGSSSSLPTIALQRGTNDNGAGPVSALWAPANDMTEDYLIHPEILPGVTFQQFIDRTKAPQSGIGPRIKAALVAMGYTPANAKDFISRALVAEIVREEVPIASATKRGADKTGEASMLVRSHAAWLVMVLASAALCLGV